MVVTKYDLRLTFSQHFLCGGIAGMAAKTLTAPLDVIKIRTQVGSYETRGTLLDSVKHIYKHGGLKTFWKGNFVSCCRLLPFSVVHLAAFYRMKRLLADPCGRLSPFTALLAGGGAGLVATLVLYPSDTIKTRLIVQPVHPEMMSYRGFIHATKTMLQNEGPASFYNGVSTSILGVVPFTAATFFTYEMLDVLYRTFNFPITPFSNFLNGCIAALVAQTASFPFDTIRKKMQAKSDLLPYRGNIDVNFEGMVDAFRKTIKYVGWRGLWNGCLINAIKVVPYSGIMLASYEYSKNWCLYFNGYTRTPYTDDPHPGIDQSMKPEELDDYFEEMHYSELSSEDMPWWEDEIDANEDLAD